MNPVQIALMKKSKSNAHSTSGSEEAFMKDLEDIALLILESKFQALSHDEPAETIVDDALQFIAKDTLEGFQNVPPPSLVRVVTPLAPPTPARAPPTPECRPSNDIDDFLQGDIQGELEGIPVESIDDTLQFTIQGAHEGFHIVTPPSLTKPSPERRSSKEVPAKKTRKAKSSIRSRSNKAAPSRGSCLLPTASDPEDPTFLTSLYTESEAGKINPVHVAIRRDILAVRRTVSGRVFFQCKCCKHLPRTEREKLSTFAPRNVETIYRSFVRFMMVHVPSCAHMPAEIKALDAKSLRDNKVTGVKEYWTASALEMGLKDEGTSIVYDP